MPAPILITDTIQSKNQPAIENYFGSGAPPSNATRAK